MCGIAGIIDNDRAKPAASAELAGMLAFLEHRGPDGEGTALFAGACLGHRRLAIIDLSESGAQPFANEDRSVFAVVNGEIYNHRELRHGLESRGHRFRSRSDSEVVVHLYEEHGAGFAARLEGMFAAAVWDERCRALTLARDRMGEKPLFYLDISEGGSRGSTGGVVGAGNSGAGRFAFASGISAFFALDATGAGAGSGLATALEPDDAALHQFLALRFVPSPLTGFRGIRKLPPAHVLRHENGRTTVTRYWTMPEAVSPIDGAARGAQRPGPGARMQPAEGAAQPADELDAARELRRLIAESVAGRIESDVPLGLLLSGGLDSSILAIEMAAATGRDFDTFSAGFPGTEYDESDFAAGVAHQTGSRHHRIEVSPDAVSALPRLVLRYGEPFADSSAVAMEALAAAVRPHVKVVIGGDGADELFGGYDRYRALALAARIGAGAGAGAGRRVASAIGRTLSSLPTVMGAHGRKNIPGRLARFAEALGKNPLAQNEAWLSCFSETALRAIAAPEFARRSGGADPFGALSDFHDSADPIEAAMRADVAVTLPDRMLFKVDGATMSAGLEARSPFLATPIVEWAMAAETAWKIGGRSGGARPGIARSRLVRSGTGWGKQILRLAYADDLPPAIMKRRKAGFGLPIDRWLRGPLRIFAGDLLASGRPSIVARGYCTGAGIQALIDEHHSGRRNHDDRIWALLCLELWFRTFIDRRPESPARPTAARAQVTP